MNLRRLGATILALVLVQALGSCGDDAPPEPATGPADGPTTLTRQDTPEDAAAKAGAAADTAAPPPALTREEARQRELIASFKRQLAEEEDPLARAEVFARAAELGPAAKSLLPEAVKALAAEDEDLRAFALAAVVALDPAGARPHLEKALKDPSVGVRLKAIEAWGTAAIPDLLPLLAQAKDEYDDRVRQAALLVIEKRGDAILVPQVAAALDALGPLSAPPAVRFLAAHKATAEAGRIADLLTWSDPALRVQVADALRKLGTKDPKAIEALIQALGDEEEPVREAANTSLEVLTGKTFVFKAGAPKEQRDVAVKAWKDWFSANKGSL